VEVQSVALQAAEVVAIKQLKSGDISLLVRLATKAEVMQWHRAVWCRQFGTKAYVKIPTWGNIVYGIPIRSIDIKKQEAMINCIIADNHHHWAKHTQITYIGWLKPTF
jgi:hypothetical protein